MDLLDHSGTLLKYEIENKQPCTPLSSHFLPVGLNPNWNSKLTEPQFETIADFHDHWEVTGPKAFDEVVREIIGTCGRTKPEQVAFDRDTVMDVYAQLRGSDDRLPPPSAINEDWAIYRRLQIELIAAHEYMFSFQDDQFRIGQDRKAHNQIDFRVLVAASLAGGVATRDRLIKRYFNILCPEGILYWLGR